MTSDLDQQQLGSRPPSVWQGSVATMFGVVVERVMWCLAHRLLCLQFLTRGHCVPLFFFLFFFLFSCFNQSAMAYMVCCGPKIRRRKLNNVFLFFKGRATVGWLWNSFDRPEGTMAFVQFPTQRNVSSERAWVGFFKHILADLLLIIPS